jgi:hypothetical protein
MSLWLLSDRSAMDALLGLRAMDALLALRGMDALLGLLDDVPASKVYGATSNI